MLDKRIHADLSESFIASKFYELVSRPVHNRANNTYNGECPICNEGKSKGTKRRLFYLPEDNYVCCHNCNNGGRGKLKPINWIMEVTGESFGEVVDEFLEFDTPISEVIKSRMSLEEKLSTLQIKPRGDTLPKDSINLFDKNQLRFYEDDKIVKLAIAYIKKRKLNSAKHRPESLWISLTDPYHKNRLTFPFYDIGGSKNISFYQTRALLKVDEDEAKYKSKFNADKTVFNIVNVNPDIPFIFEFEGPIDSCFVQNGIALAGIDSTEIQSELILSNFPFHQRIKVLDNHLYDSKEVRKKRSQLIKRGERLFFFPKEFKKFKDFNDICVYLDKTEIPYDFVVRNSFKGMEAEMKLLESGRSLN